MSVKCPQCGEDLRYVNSINSLICNSCGFSESLPVTSNASTSNKKGKARMSWALPLKWGTFGIICSLAVIGATNIFWKTQIDQSSVQRSQSQAQQPTQIEPTTTPTYQAEIEPSQDNNNSLDNSSPDIANANTTISYKNLILGRWVFKQTLFSNGQVASSKGFHLEIEFFEDNTYREQT